MKKHNNMRGELRTRLLMQAIMIQVVLTVRIGKTWLEIKLDDDLMVVYLVVMII